MKRGRERKREGGKERRKGKKGGREKKEKDRQRQGEGREGGREKRKKEGKKYKGGREERRRVEEGRRQRMEKGRKDKEKGGREGRRKKRRRKNEGKKYKGGWEEGKKKEGETVLAGEFWELKSTRILHFIISFFFWLVSLEHPEARHYSCALELCVPDSCESLICTSSQVALQLGRQQTRPAEKEGKAMGDISQPQKSTSECGRAV
ncbi:nst1, partial [Ophiophagus hannah]